MPKPTPWKDEYTLLCERCGYAVEGLDQSLPCPECGKPIEESLPNTRKGTPFQQHPSFRSTIQTAWMTIHTPDRVIEQMAFHQTRLLTPAARYLTYSILACCVLLFAPGVIQMMLPHEPHTPAPGEQSNLILNALFGLGILSFLALLIWMGFMILTHVFAGCITILMKLVRGRFDANVGLVIAGHAAIGWTFTGLIWVCGLHIENLIGYLVPTESEYAYRDQVFFLIDDVMIPSFQLGLAIGFLIFARIAYLGIKQCRFLNRPKPMNATG